MIKKFSELRGGTIFYIPADPKCTRYLKLSDHGKFEWSGREINAVRLRDGAPMGNVPSTLTVRVGRG